MLDYRSLVDGPTFAEARPPLPEAPVAPDATLGVRRLDGTRMRTLDGVYDQCAAALQFPEWFGRNLDAFDECLRDVSAPEAPGGPVVLLVTGADEVLADEPGRRAWFGEAIDDANDVRRRRGAGELHVAFVRTEGTDDGWWAALLG